MWLLSARQPKQPFLRLATSTRGRTSRRRRVFAVALTLAILFASGLAVARTGVTHAAGASEHSDKEYLALGDSIPFGFNPLVDPHQASNFIGYPTPVARALDVRLTNAACPGATSSYFVSLAGPDWQCIPFRSNFPLHVNYSTSQLDFAVSFLRQHRQTRLVTLTIGANDLFRLQFLCGGSISCIESGLPSLLATLAANLNTTYAAIRHEAHYRGQLVALTYYSNDYRNATNTAIIHALDQVIAARTLAWGGAVADGFSAFAAASAGANGDPCAAGLLIRLSATTCDVHPSVAGRLVLAATVLAVVHHNDAKSIAG